MRTVHLARCMRIGFLALLLVAMAPVAYAAQETDTETSHTFDQFGVTVAWEPDWQVANLVEGSITRVSLDYQSSVFAQVILFEAMEISPAEALDLLLLEDATLLYDNRDSDIPSFTQIYSDFGTEAYWEAYLLEDETTVVVVGLEYLPVLKDESIRKAQVGLTINGTSPYRGSIVEESQVTDLTGDATPQAEGDVTPQSTEAASPEATEETSRTSRTPRTGSDATETPDATEAPEIEIEATAEATEEPGVITRTPRTGSNTTETPEATEAPEIEVEATAEVTEEPEDTNRSQGLDSYTSGLYGFTINFDPNIWQLGDTLETSTVDGVLLDGESSTVFFIGTSEYGADPVGCLIGEDEYFSTESESISNWEVATGGDGEPLWYESDELAWGVFRYTYTLSDGSAVEFVDYISCETIPGEEAVLMVQLTSTPADYNDNLDAVLDVLDTIEFQP